MHTFTERIGPGVKVRYFPEMIRRRHIVASLLLIIAGRLPPLAAEAQQAGGIPRIGLLRPGAPTDPADRASVGAFLSGLQEAGYMQGQHVEVESRYAHGDLGRFPSLARELVALQVTAIVTSNPYATRAAREASRTIPIIVALDYETDPIASGWVVSLARPGGNLTGLFLDQPGMSGKLLQLLKEAVPSLTKVAVLWDETIGRLQLDSTESAARVVGLTLKPLGVRGAPDLPDAFAIAARERAAGLVVLTSPLLSLHRARIAELALAHRLPGVTLFTNFPSYGFLMAYGPNQPDAFHRAAGYVARILNGRQPAELPIQRPEKFELVINLKTAKAFGLTIPPSLLTRADEVIP
jgi:putative ABC transport system substrate-binding protein